MAFEGLEILLLQPRRLGGRWHFDLLDLAGQEQEHAGGGAVLGGRERAQLGCLGRILARGEHGQLVQINPERAAHPHVFARGGQAIAGAHLEQVALFVRALAHLQAGHHARRDAFGAEAQAGDAHRLLELERDLRQVAAGKEVEPAQRGVLHERRRRRQHLDELLAEQRTKAGAYTHDVTFR